LEGLPELTRKALLEVRQKLLDLSKKNRLLNFKETSRAIRINDSSHNYVFNTLVHELKSMSFLYMDEEESSQISLLNIDSETPSKEAFIINQIKALRSKYPYGVNLAYSGIEAEFKKLFPSENLYGVLSKMEQEGLITLKKVKTGLIINVTGKHPKQNKEPAAHVDENSSETDRHDLTLKTPYSSTVLERRCGRLLQDARTAVEALALT